jgi:2'-5' RNA ligase
MQKTIIPQATTTVYDIGVRELHRISQDETVRKEIDHQLNESRGRETARLHVTLTALNAMDRKNMEALEAMASELQARVAELSHAVAGTEGVAEKRAQEIVTLTSQLTTTLRENADATRNHLMTLQNSLSTQVHEARLALANQADGSLQSLSSQQRENTERLAVDVRKLRDEVVSLVDSRMNQADASFAALRGDVEVVKYLVMDLIKDRIGRNDPKSKTY